MVKYPRPPSPFHDVSASNYTLTAYCNLKYTESLATIHKEVRQKIYEKFVIDKSDVQLNKIVYNDGEVKSALFISMTNFKTQKTVGDIEKSLQVCLVDDVKSVTEVYDVNCTDYYE